MPFLHRYRYRSPPTTDDDDDNDDHDEDEEVVYLGVLNLSDPPFMSIHPGCLMLGDGNRQDPHADQSCAGGSPLSTE